VVSLALVVLVLLVLGPLDLWLARLRPSARAATPPLPPSRRTAGDRAVTVIVWLYAASVAGIPMLTLILTALTRGPGLPPVPANWTLANFAAGFSGGAGAALVRSAGLALAAAVLAPLLGSAVAALARGRWRGLLATVVTLGIRAPPGAGRAGPAAARPDPGRAAERRVAGHGGAHGRAAAAHRGRDHRQRAGVRAGLPRAHHVHDLCTGRAPRRSRWSS
jgi:hypothetical protein